jgi:hypothetical protein
MQHRRLPPLALHFNTASRRRLEPEFGRGPIRRIDDWPDAYAVVNDCGAVTTIGHRCTRGKGIMRAPVTAGSAVGHVYTMNASLLTAVSAAVSFY